MNNGFPIFQVSHDADSAGLIPSDNPTITNKTWAEFQFAAQFSATSFLLVRYNIYNSIYRVILIFLYHLSSFAHKLASHSCSSCYIPLIWPPSGNTPPQRHNALYIRSIEPLVLLCVREFGTSHRQSGWLLKHSILRDIKNCPSLSYNDLTQLLQFRLAYYSGSVYPAIYRKPFTSYITITRTLPSWIRRPCLSGRLP